MPWTSADDNVTRQVMVKVEWKTWAVDHPNGTIEVRARGMGDAYYAAKKQLGIHGFGKVSNARIVG